MHGAVQDDGSGVSLSAEVRGDGSTRPSDDFAKKFPEEIPRLHVLSFVHCVMVGMALPVNNVSLVKYLPIDVF